MDPVAEGWGKAKVSEDMGDALNIDVVEEALYVEENDRCNQLAFDSGLSIVGKTEGCIDCAVVIS